MVELPTTAAQQLEKMPLANSYNITKALENIV